MANHAVAADEQGVRNKALVAGVIDTVTIDRDCDQVEVLKMSAGVEPIYFTVDGSDPVVGGNKTYIVPDGALEVDVRSAGDTVVKLISAGTPSYSVTGTF